MFPRPALRTILTRVITNMNGTESNGLAIPEIGITQARHNLSRYNGDPFVLERLAKGDPFIMAQSLRQSEGCLREALQHACEHAAKDGSQRRDFRRQPGTGQRNHLKSKLFCVPVAIFSVLPS